MIIFLNNIVHFEYINGIIGHQNAITYKEIFPLIKDNKIWLGYGFKGGAGHFISKYEDTATAGDHREGMIRVSGVNWFTNLEIKKRHEDLILFKSYNSEDYPKYCNYDAINVDKTSEIPMDYDGKIGVPITFLDKYNPQQFEIIGISLFLATNKPEDLPKNKQGGPAFYLKKDGEYKRLYARIVIRKKQQSAYAIAAEPSEPFI